MHDRPPLPQGCPRQFRATVHGTVFAGRDRHIDHMSAGAEVPCNMFVIKWLHSAKRYLRDLR